MSISPELIELAKKLAENARAKVIEERKRIEAIRQLVAHKSAIEKY